jgi:hypothetical protein
MSVYYKADIISSITIIIISLNVPCSRHDIVEKLLMFGVKKQSLIQKASCDWECRMNFVSEVKNMVLCTY